MKIKPNRRLYSWVAFLLLTLVLLWAAISILLKDTGKRVVGFIEGQVISHVLKADDVEMGCVMAESFTLLVPSLAQLNVSPFKLAVVLDFLSGSCSDFKAWEEELRYLRAMYAKNVTEAQDARISQKRYLTLTARRLLSGYQNLELAYSEAPGTGCPDFNTENEEFYWLVGLMNGLQAVLNDLASEGGAKVPLDISLKVGRGAACLNNKKWWGLPNAIQAAIWVNFPGDKPKDTKPLEVLELAVQTGLEQSMRITQVIAAKIYIGLGDTERVKDLIRDNVKARISMPANPRFLFLDQVAIVQLQAISDIMWTEATGKRTPVGGLGTFWNDPDNTVDTVDIIDIL